MSDSEQEQEHSPPQTRITRAQGGANQRRFTSYGWEESCAGCQGRGRKHTCPKVQNPNKRPVLDSRQPLRRTTSPRLPQQAGVMAGGPGSAKGRLAARGEPWDDEQDAELTAQIENHGEGNMEAVTDAVNASFSTNRSATAVFSRWRKFLRGAWHASQKKRGIDDPAGSTAADADTMDVSGSESDGESDSDDAIGESESEAGTASSSEDLEPRTTRSSRGAATSTPGEAIREAQGGQDAENLAPPAAAEEAVLALGEVNLDASLAGDGQRSSRDSASVTASMPSNPAPSAVVAVAGTVEKGFKSAIAPGEVRFMYPANADAPTSGRQSRGDAWDLYQDEVMIRTIESFGEAAMGRVMLTFNSKLGKQRTQIAIYSRWRKKVRPVYAAGLWPPTAVTEDHSTNLKYVMRHLQQRQQGYANPPGHNSDDDEPVGTTVTAAGLEHFGDGAKSRPRMLRKEPQSVRAYSPEQQLRSQGAGGGSGHSGSIGTRGVLWKHDDDQRLIELVEAHGEDDWKLITAEFNKGRPLDSGRTSIAIYSRWRKRIRERWIAQPGSMAPTLAQQRKPRKTAGTYDRDDYWFDDVTVHEFSSSPQSKRSHKKKAGKEFERPRYKHASPASQGRPLTAPVNMPKVFDWFQCNACNLFLPLVPPYPATPRRCSRCIAEGRIPGAQVNIPPVSPTYATQLLKTPGMKPTAPAAYGAFSANPGAKRPAPVSTVERHVGASASDQSLFGSTAAMESAQPLQSSVARPTKAAPIISSLSSNSPFGTPTLGADEPLAKKPKHTPFHCAPAVAFTRAVLDGSLEHGKTQATYVIPGDNADLNRCDHVGFCTGCGKCRKVDS